MAYSPGFLLAIEPLNRCSGRKRSSELPPDLGRRNIDDKFRRASIVKVADKPCSERGCYKVSKQSNDLQLGKQSHQPRCLLCGNTRAFIAKIVILDATYSRSNIVEVGSWSFDFDFKLILVTIQIDQFSTSVNTKALIKPISDLKRQWPALVRVSNSGSRIHGREEVSERNETALKT